MATYVIMPRQGQSVESCIIAKWHKKKGDSVAIGDLLFSYETDKASFDEEAKVEGVVLEIFHEEGDDVPCLSNVCAIGQPGEAVENSTQDAQAETKPEEKTVEIKIETTSAPETATEDVQGFDTDHVKISPRAKSAADRAGVDIAKVVPTGPYGRIIERDVLEAREKGYLLTAAAKAALAGGDTSSVAVGSGIGGRITTADLGRTAAPAAESAAAAVQQPIQPEIEIVKIPNIRKVIAKAMQNSISSTCQLTLNSSFDATEIMEFRKKLKAGKEKLGLENITINDMILFAVSRTLTEFRDLNANMVDDTMIYYKNVNLGVAVDTERGLMVPNIFNANHKSLSEISSEVKNLVKDCQSGKISPDVLKNGSFTVTNLGTLDVESFTPVLNAPQTGILGVNNIIQRAKEVDGEMVFYPAMGLSLTFDHKALDGAPAAKFLQALKRNLENFTCLLIK